MATSNNNDTTSRGTKRARDDTAEGNEASSSQQAGVKRPRTSFPEPPSSGTAIPPTSSKSKVDTNAFQSSQVPSTSTPASPSIPNVNLPSKPKPLTRSRPIYHHPTLWFEDGDIIFQLRNLRYRVHRAKLAEHISYFDDMFSLPQPQQNQRASRKGKAKEIEPEEVVLEDGVEDEDDFELVLWWIYVGRETPDLDKPLKKIYAQALSLIRLGDKYASQAMISSGFTLLEHIYPSSLQKFLTHGQSAARLPPFCHFVAIRLADEYGHPIIRPMAMYCAALLRYKFLLEGDVDNEGNRHFLSADDAALVLAGRDEMRAMGRRFTYAYLIECALMNQGASPLCHNKPVLDSDSDIAKPDKPKSWTCQKWLKQLYVALDQNRFFEEKSIGIHLLSKKSWNTVTRNMCSDCVRELNKHVGFGVEDCWETIPQIFEQGLCWEQMRMKEENAQVPLK